MKKKILIILLSLVAALCLAFGLVACSDNKDGGSTDNTEQTSPNDNTGSTDDSGNTDSTETPDDDGGEDQTIAATSVSLNVTSLSLEVGESATLTATVLPSNATDKSVTWTTSSSSVATVSGGTVKAVGAGTATITVKTSNGKTATCTVTVSTPTCAITSVEGATIDGTDIFMFVDCNTDSVSLLNKVTVSSGSWELYSDILEQNLIATKIAAGSDGVLADGENTFYILLKDDGGESVAVYTLTVYRSYAVKVSYYNHENALVTTDVAYTGYEYEANYTYSVDGYTFNGWLEGGESYQTRVLWGNLSLYADMVPNSYSAIFNANGGTVSAETQTVTFMESYVLLIPEREGYSFVGWYAGETQLTDENGQSLSVWKYAYDAEVTAKWEINQYDVNIEYDSEAGTVTGTETGTYDYGTEITLTASSPNLGYDFIGWYDGDDNLLTTKYSYNFVLGMENVSLTAKYEIWKELVPFTFTSTADTLTITGVKDSSVIELVVPNYVTEIAAGAFSGCASLTSITLPFVGGSANATEASSSTLFGYIFGTSSYTGGTATKQYYIGSSSYTTYYIPTTLTSVTITGGEILYGAFYNCSNLISITIPDSVTSIGERAFYNCTSLENITIPDGVTSIGSSAFYNCASLESVYITDLTAWCNISFGDSFSSPMYYASQLYLNNKVISGDIVLEDGITAIPWGTFKNSSIASITIPDSVISIGSWAFCNCTSLKIITIGSGVTSIGSYAFYGCTALTEIYYNATDCEDLTGGSSSKSNFVFYNAGKNSDGITVTIGANVKSIPAYLFYPYYSSSSYSPNIVSIVFEAGSVCTSIGSSAFYGCSSLEGVYITDITAWLNISFDSDTSNPLSYAGNLYLNNELVTELVIPDGVTSIGSCAFYNCSSLESIDIPDGVTSIGGSAFRGCSSLTNVTIGSGVTSIGSYAFYNCTSLAKIYYNATSCEDLSSGNHVFSNAGKNGNGITVTIGANVEKIPAYLFYVSKSSLYLPKIVSVVFEENSVCASIGSSAFRYCTSLKSVTIPDSVTYIGDYAFYNCTSLKSVTIGNSVTYIGNSAFYDCKITSVTIPNSVSSIGNYAFYNCTSLTEIYYNATACEDLSLNNYVFYNAGKNYNGITVTIGANVKSIPAYLFYPCNISSYYSPNIVNIVFEEGSVCTSIGNYAFAYLTSLTGITIPDSVTTIGSTAFGGCSSLESITLPFVGSSNSATSASSSTLFGYIFGTSSYTGGTSTVQYYGSSSSTTYYIPSSLVSVTITGSSILYGTFYGCTSLTSVTIGNDVNSIGDYAFYGCTSLTSITIGNSVTSIGNYAFSDCTSLTSVTFENADGWWVSTSSTATSGTDISSSSLSNTSTAATYLTSTYASYYWKRS